jgi:hypothetical protein
MMVMVVVMVMVMVMVMVAVRLIARWRPTLPSLPTTSSRCGALPSLAAKAP